MCEPTEPTRFERFQGHPLTTAFAIWAVLVGLIFVWEGATVERATESSIALFPQWADLLIGASFFLSGPLLLLSIFSCTRWDDRRYEWRKAGFTLLVPAGGFYSYLVVDTVPLELLAFAFGMLHLTVGLFGLIATMAQEANARKELRHRGYKA